MSSAKAFMFLVVNFSFESTLFANMDCDNNGVYLADFQMWLFFQTKMFWEPHSSLSNQDQVSKLKLFARGDWS